MKFLTIPVVAGIMSVLPVYADFVTATLTTGTTPYAGAVDPIANKTYVANYGSSTLTVIDGFTLQTSTLAVGQNPRAIAVNSLTHMVYVANYGDSSITVIDASNNQTTSIATKPTPCAIAINPTTNKIYAVHFASASVTVIDGATNDTATLSTGVGPSALCVNPVTNKIYIANSISNTVTIVNGATGGISGVLVGTTPISIAANTVTNRIYVANQGSNTVSEIDGTTSQVISMNTGSSPCAVAVNPVTDRVYVCNSGGNSVTVFDSLHGATTIPAGSSPAALTVNTTNNRIYVTNSGDGTVTIIDGVTNLTAVLTVGTNPGAVTANPITNRIFISNAGSNTESVVAEALSSQITTLGIAQSPYAITVNPTGNKVYISSYNNSKVNVIDGETNQIQSLDIASAGPVAINPVTNKIYVGSNGSNKLLITIDGATNQISGLPVRARPGEIVVNPVTNKVYFSSDTGIYLFDVPTGQLTTIIPSGRFSFGGVNPATNKIYFGSNSNYVTVIDGTTNQTTNVNVNGTPRCIAVNAMANKIYVSVQLGFISVIDGATSTVSTISIGTNSYGIRVNPVTDKVYIADYYSSNFAIVDGSTKKAVTLAGMEAYPYPFGSDVMAVDPVANRVVFANLGSSTAMVIDGATNQTAILASISQPLLVAINPVTKKVYVANYSQVTIIDEMPKIPTKVSTFFNPLTFHATTSARPLLSGISTDNLLPGRTGIFSALTSMNTSQKSWRNASVTTGSGTDSVSWSWTWDTDSLCWGENYLCALALDSQSATTNNPGLGTPFAGNIAVYPVYRVANLTLPESPNLVLPANESTGLATAVAFSWNKAQRASSYILQVAPDTLFSNLVFTQSLINDTIKSVSGLSTNAIYYWRVAASNSFGIGPWSTIWVFSTIAVAPVAPILSAPANGVLGIGIRPNLEWNAAAAATSYTIQVSSESDFSSLAASDSLITGLSYQCSYLPSFSFFYWRVKAVNTGGASPWSAVWTFTTGAVDKVINRCPLPRFFSASISKGMIKYALPVACHVRIRYFDVSGRLVVSLVNKQQESGWYSQAIGAEEGCCAAYCVDFEAGAFVKRQIVIPWR